MEDIMHSDADKVLAKSLDAELKKIAADIVVGGDLESGASVIQTKEDIVKDLTPDHELHRLFVGTEKYNKPISELRNAIASGAKVINVVAPGYNGGSSVKNVTDLIVSSAMQESSALPEDAPEDVKRTDLDRRNRRRKKSLVSEVSFEPMASSEEASSQADSKVDSSLLGGVKFKPNTDSNLLYAWVKRQALGIVSEGMEDIDGEVDQGKVDSAMMQLRSSLPYGDLIFDPNNERSYLYPCLSYRGNDISAIEQKAQQTRDEMKKNPDSVPTSLHPTLSKAFEKINGSLELYSSDREESFMPYGLAHHGADSARTQVRDYKLPDNDSYPDPTKLAVSTWMMDNDPSVSGSDEMPTKSSEIVQ